MTRKKKRDKFMKQISMISDPNYLWKINKENQVTFKQVREYRQYIKFVQLKIQFLGLLKQGNAKSFTELVKNAMRNSKTPQTFKFYK